MKRKGEMGIGTLIIFIALLLVAAIAAAVLIQTAGSLQEKSLSTGEQARGNIATSARVIEVSAGNGRQGTLLNFTTIMKLSSGSDPIKISQCILTMNTFNNTATLTYAGDGAKLERNETSGYFTNTTSGTGAFSVEYLQTGPNFVQGNLQRGDVIKIYFESPREIGEDESIRLNFIPKIGTPTLTEFNTPEVISEERVYLYP
jgi:archaeal flagellin FlaB